MVLGALRQFHRRTPIQLPSGYPPTLPRYLTYLSVGTMASSKFAFIPTLSMPSQRSVCALFAQP